MVFVVNIVKATELVSLASWNCIQPTTTQSYSLHQKLLFLR